MTKIMLLNGPPRCGKDVGANAVTAYLEDFECVHLKLSQPLKDIVSQIVGLPQEVLETRYKSAIIPGFGTTYRDLQIHTYLSMSKVFGESWLGKTLVNRIKALGSGMYVVSDAGLDADIEPLLKAFHPSDIMIVQIMREGCFFNYDIRGYISNPRVQMRHVVNNDLADFTSTLIDFALEFFAE